VHSKIIERLALEAMPLLFIANRRLDYARAPSLGISVGRVECWPFVLISLNPRIVLLDSLVKHSHTLGLKHGTEFMGSHITPTKLFGDVRSINFPLFIQGSCIDIFDKIRLIRCRGTGRSLLDARRGVGRSSDKDGCRAPAFTLISCRPSISER
jgi:hypothetical protein